MGYSSGMLRWMVTVYNRKEDVEVKFGSTTEYEKVACLHANVTWKKGQKSLNEGSLDAQDTVLIRMRWNRIVNRFSRLEFEGVTYQIQSLHADRKDNTLQITATEIITK